MFAAALALLVSVGACKEPARRLASGPGGEADALALAEAMGLRFGPSTREPAFETLRPKLARAAFVPSWIWDDPAAWLRQGDSFRAVDFAGYQSGSEYRFGLRAEAPEPTAAGQYRGQLRLDRLKGGRYEWTVREELAVGALSPATLAAALEALLLGAEAADEPRARAAIASAFPRATARLGELLSIDQLVLEPDVHGATTLRLALRLDTARLRSTAPRFAAFLDKYLGPIRARAVATDASGATWWTLDGERHLWTLRLRSRAGSLVPLEGDALRRIPERLRVTADYSTRMGRFEIAARGLVSEVALTRTPTEKGFVAHFRQKPDWQLPFLVESLLGSPLQFPFDGPGSEAGWSARETPSGTRLVRRYRARVAENFVLRWLGGMTSRALSEFRSGAEREADRFYGESLAALREDLIALLGRDNGQRRTDWRRTDRGQTMTDGGSRTTDNESVDGFGGGLSAPSPPLTNPRR